MAFDPVAISFANANKERESLDRMKQDQNQVLGQVLSVAGQQDRRNEFGASMAERAANQTESNRRFDIVRNLQERQFELQKMQSFASMAAAKSAQELRALEIGQKVQQINEEPMRQAASMQLMGILSQAQDTAELQKATEKISKTPELFRYLPQSAIAEAVTSTRLNLANTKKSLLEANMAAKDIEDQNEGAELGLNPMDFRTTDGNVDMTLFRNALGQRKQEQQISTIERQTDSRLRIAQEQTRGRIEAAKARIDGNSRLPEATKIRVNALFKQAEAAQGAFKPDLAADYIAQAEAILAGSETGLPAQEAPSISPPLIGVNKKTGEKVQLINGEWVPVK